MKKILLALLCLSLIPFTAVAENFTQELVQIENGTVADFDGDGMEEPVAFVTERDSYGDGSFTLTVGNTTFTQENCISLNEELYAVAIPQSAFSSEILGTLFIASENGPSDDPVSYCYFYTGSRIYDSSATLYNAGCIAAYPQDMRFSGKEIETVLRTDILGTWRRPAQFVLAFGYQYDESSSTYTENYHLTEVPQDLYSMGLIAETKIDLPLQVSRTDATIVGVVPAGSKIAFGATDNLHWVYAESFDGQVCGWFYLDMSDYPTMINVNGTMMDENDVFADLMYAD